MPDPNSPAEIARLQTLKGYDLLDTPPEPEFERITALAAKLFDAPIALVALVDADRLWFKSRRGLESSELPREMTFCTYAIRENRPFIVPDATLDERFANSPVVTGPAHVRFYAGVPLTTGAGMNLGTLCVLDTVPRNFNDSDTDALTQLAAITTAAIEARLTEQRSRSQIAIQAQTEQTLRLVEARYKRIAENTPGMVYQFVRRADGSAEFLFVSDACREILELEPATLLADAGSYFELIHPKDRAGREKVVAEALATMKSARWDGRHVLPSGQIKWLQTSSQPERAPNGDVLWDGVVVDITERKRAEDRLLMLESSVENANDAILVTKAEPLDEPGPRIIYANRAFTRTTGYTEADVLGKNPRMFQGPNTDPTATKKIRQALDRWEAVRVEILNYRKDGSEFWVELNIVPVANERGWYTHWVSVQREITERKAAQVILEQARDEAQRANAAKSEFLSRMSHELRTPLNAILGFGQLLEMQAQTDRQRENVSHILSGGRHLLELINEVLDISRIESGKIELVLAPIEVAEVFNEASALIQPLAAKRNVHVGRCSGQACDGVVQADRQRLKQIVLNLLSNAVKYNRPGGTVSLSCDPATTPGQLRLSVSDTGPGLTSADVSKLFVPFERLGAERSGVEGTGIGLALAKRLVEAMGGTIGVESTPGRGSTFYVELPFSDTLATGFDNPVTPMQDQAASGPAVLYIEDNPSNYALVAQVLEFQRPTIRLLGAMLGQLGLDMAREHRPDLILLDLQLPDVAGDEVLRQLRADENTRDIPVVMVSADATTEQPRRLLALGARAYLTKPLKIAELVRAVDDALSDKIGLSTLSF